MKTITTGSNMKDVARLAGVSVATVSRVLNGFHGVNEGTQHRVMMAIEKLGYIPNYNASSLRTLKTKVMLVVVPDLSNTFFTEIIRGIEETAHARNYTIYIAETVNSEERERELVMRLRRQQVDSVIFLTARIDGGLFTDLSRNLPIVLACETLPGLKVPQVGIDNLQAGFDATQTLITLGHKHIVHIQGKECMQLSHDRRRGYEMAMRQEHLRSTTFNGDFTFGSGVRAGQEILVTMPECTAVFAANDDMALGVMWAFTRAGRSIPGDISVMGFDDVAMSTMVIPTLSTVSQPRRMMGQKAATMAFEYDAMHDRAVDILAHTVVLRESTRQLG
jgi:LacI family repressor for deo operon, udp, cdd, tsx, nupC, and nupG